MNFYINEIIYFIKTAFVLISGCEDSTHPHHIRNVFTYIKIHTLVDISCLYLLHFSINKRICFFKTAFVLIYGRGDPTHPHRIRNVFTYIKIHTLVDISCLYLLHFSINKRICSFKTTFVLIYGRVDSTHHHRIRNVIPYIKIHTLVDISCLYLLHFSINKRICSFKTAFVLIYGRGDPTHPHRIRNVFTYIKIHTLVDISCLYLLHFSVNKTICSFKTAFVLIYWRVDSTHPYRIQNVFTYIKIHTLVDISCLYLLHFSVNKTICSFKTAFVLIYGRVDSTHHHRIRNVIPYIKIHTLVDISCLYLLHFSINKRICFFKTAFVLIYGRVDSTHHHRIRNVFTYIKIHTLVDISCLYLLHFSVNKRICSFKITFVLIYGRVDPTHPHRIRNVFTYIKIHTLVDISCLYLLHFSINKRICSFKTTFVLIYGRVDSTHHHRIRNVIPYIKIHTLVDISCLYLLHFSINKRICFFKTAFVLIYGRVDSTHHHRIRNVFTYIKIHTLVDISCLYLLHFSVNKRICSFKITFVLIYGRVDPTHPHRIRNVFTYIKIHTLVDISCLYLLHFSVNKRICSFKITFVLIYGRVDPTHPHRIRNVFTYIKIHTLVDISCLYLLHFSINKRICSFKTTFVLIYGRGDSTHHHRIRNVFTYIKIHTLVDISCLYLLHFSINKRICSFKTTFVLIYGRGDSTHHHRIRNVFTYIKIHTLVDISCLYLLHFSINKRICFFKTAFVLIYGRVDSTHHHRIRNVFTYIKIHTLVDISCLYLLHFSVNKRICSFKITFVLIYGRVDPTHPHRIRNVFTYIKIHTLVDISCLYLLHFSINKRICFFKTAFVLIYGRVDPTHPHRIRNVFTYIKIHTLVDISCLYLLHFSINNDMHPACYLLVMCNFHVT